MCAKAAATAIADPETDKKPKGFSNERGGIVNFLPEYVSYISVAFHLMRSRNDGSGGAENEPAAGGGGGREKNLLFRMNDKNLDSSKTPNRQVPKKIG